MGLFANPLLARVLAVSPLILGLATAGTAQGRALTVEAKLNLLAERERTLVPIPGSVVASYRQRGSPEASAVVVYDSAQPAKYPEGESRVPCWLPLVLTLRVEGLRDGSGALYSGPLVAHLSDRREILGPYPEGFICAVAGAFTISAVPTFGPFMEGPVGLTVYYRPPPAFVLIDGQPWPPDPEYRVDEPVAEVPICGRTFRFVGHSVEGDGFRASPVQTRALGDQRSLTAQGVFAMDGGAPAHSLPVRIEWRIDDPAEGPPERITNEAVTDADGRVSDTVLVPLSRATGHVRFWCHDVAAEYLPASGVDFDFSEDGQ